MIAHATHANRREDRRGQAWLPLFALVDKTHYHSKAKPMVRTSLVLLVLLCESAVSHAQWLHYPTPGTPRTRDGKPEPGRQGSAGAERQARSFRNLDGFPGFGIAARAGGAIAQHEFTDARQCESVFRVLIGKGGDVFKDFVVPGDDPRTFSRYFLNILADFKPGEVPMRPEAAALFRKRTQAGNREGPSARCMPHGIPQGDLDNYLPLKILRL